MKQLGLFTSFYTSEADDFFFPSNFRSNWNNLNKDMRWPGLFGYLNLASSTRSFLCPSAGVNPNASDVYQKPHTVVTYPVASQLEYVSYGYNYRNLGQKERNFPGQSNTPLAGGGPVKTGMVKQPSSTFLMMDTGSVEAAKLSYGIYTVEDMKQTWGGRPMARHDGMVNVAWVDGHVTSERGMGSQSDGAAMVDFNDLYNTPPFNRWASAGENFWDLR